MPKRIQRQRTKGWRMPEGAIYVGRPSRWGNPFRVWPSGGPEYSPTAAAAVASHRAFIKGVWRAHPEWFAPLRGHDLACWCPLEDENGNRVPCHADVLLELANREQGDRLRSPDRADV
jgi:hypothetical protein